MNLHQRPPNHKMSMRVCYIFMKRARSLFLLVAIFVSLDLIVLNRPYYSNTPLHKISVSNRQYDVHAETFYKPRVQNAKHIGDNIIAQTEALIPEVNVVNDLELTDEPEGDIDVECEWMKNFKWRPGNDRHNFNYLITPANQCGGKAKSWKILGQQKTLLLILVTSALENIARRDAQRRTWIQWSIDRGLPTHTLFLLGASSDRKLMDDIRKEAAMHDDIVQEDFVDTYYNLTVKTIMAFKWAATYCGNSVDFVMKTDDDTVLNVDNLVRDLAGASSRFHTNYFAGWARHDLLPQEDPDSKWCFPRRLFPDVPDIYSPFPLGGGYLMTPDVAMKLYRRSQVSRLFPFEDVYVGMLLEELGMRIRSRSSIYLASYFIRHGDGTYSTDEYSLYALTKGYLTWDISTETVDVLWDAILTNKWPPNSFHRRRDIYHYDYDFITCDQTCVDYAQFLP